VDVFWCSRLDITRFKLNPEIPYLAQAKALQMRDSFSHLFKDVFNQIDPIGTGESLEEIS
jgi:hypothetical protein